MSAVAPDIASQLAALGGPSGGTHRVGLLGEGVDEYAKEFVGVVDLARVLADDPDERSLRFWLIELIQVSAECWDDTLVCRRVLPEDVLE